MELFVVEGPDAGRSFALGPQSVIGRDPTAAINLVDEEVSRRHAIISVGEGTATVEDLGSSNGTYIDSDQIADEVELRLEAIAGGVELDRQQRLAGVGVGELGTLGGIL